MKSIKITFKEIVSAVYRLLLVSFAICIVCINQNVFLGYLYGLIVVLYSLSYYVLKRKTNEWYSFFRLLLDYAFIFFVLYGKSANDLLNISFFLTPIVNSANYTGKFGILASLRLYGVAFIVLFSLFKFKLNFSWLIPFVVFWILNMASKVREYLTNFELYLSAPISEHEEISIYDNDKHKVLKAIIKRFNEDEWLRKLCPKIKLIACFKLEEERIRVVSSSELIFKFNFSTFFNGLKGKRLLGEVLLNKEFEINGNMVNTEGNFVKFVATKDGFYFFCVEFEEKQLSFLLQYVSKLFLFTFNQLARIFDLEAYIKQKRSSLIGNIKQRVLFIEQGTNAIHFINNKLTPVDNFFTLKNEIAKGVIPQSDDIMHVLEQEEKRARRNILIIKAKCAKQLNKASNPLYVGERENMELGQLVIFIKSLWSELGLDTEKFDIDFGGDGSAFLKKISVEIEHFEIVLDEIFQNILKYSKVKYYGKIIISKNFICLEFSNDFDVQSYDKLKTLKGQFNQSESSEMLKRTSYGMGMIKSFLAQMSVASSIDLKEKEFVLKLDLSKLIQE